MKLNKTALKYYALMFLICVGITAIISFVFLIGYAIKSGSANFALLGILGSLISVAVTAAISEIKAQLNTATVFVTERLRMKTAVGDETFYVYWAYLGKRLYQDRIYVHEKFPYYLETHRKVEDKYATPLMIDIETYEERENRISTLFTGIPTK